MKGMIGDDPQTQRAGALNKGEQRDQCTAQSMPTAVRSTISKSSHFRVELAVRVPLYGLYSSIGGGEEAVYKTCTSPLAPEPACGFCTNYFCYMRKF